MANGSIPKPYEGYKEYTLTIDSAATNFTLIRSHACKSGNIAFIQIVASISASQDDSSVAIITLPDELQPKYNLEGRVATFGSGFDVNYNVYTNRSFRVQRTPSSIGGNFRIIVSYPTAT